MIFGFLIICTIATGGFHLFCVFRLTDGAECSRDGARAQSIYLYITHQGLEAAHGSFPPFLVRVRIWRARRDCPGSHVGGFKAVLIILGHQPPPACGTPGILHAQPQARVSSL
ncbi:hypothetical protein C8Q79DRAFT_355950 [Trametes meyenii]|nr:hypothetical protein C8Q79DRAFT_355950 [Trametes meyenii]